MGSASKPYLTRTWRMARSMSPVIESRYSFFLNTLPYGTPSTIATSLPTPVSVSAVFESSSHRGRQPCALPPPRAPGVRRSRERRRQSRWRRASRAAPPAAAARRRRGRSAPRAPPVEQERRAARRAPPPRRRPPGPREVSVAYRRSPRRGAVAHKFQRRGARCAASAGSRGAPSDVVTQRPESGESSASASHTSRTNG